MHLPWLHISSRDIEDPRDEDPLHIGRHEGRDLIPWLADPEKALERAELRTPALDVASLALAAIGSEVTYFSLMGGLFSAYDRWTALSMAGVIVPTVAINQIVKAKFRYPRPPREGMHPLAFVAPGDFTFPSGHAQNAVVLGTFLALKAKRRWVRITGVTFAAAVPLSRVYLGVHYPRDVTAGALIGLTTLGVVTALERPFRDWWLSAPRGPRGFTILFAGAIAGLLSGTPLAAFPLGVGGGLAVGHDFSGGYRFKLDKPTKRQRIMQGVLGVGIIAGAGTVTRPLLKRESTAAGVLAGALVGTALTLGVPLASNLVKRAVYWRRRKLKQRRAQERRRTARAAVHGKR